MRSLAVGFALVLAAVPAFTPVASSQRGQQSSVNKAPSAPAPLRDLSGVWFPKGGGLTQATQPPFTAWGQQQFDANRPASGPREDTANTNDRYLQCDPPGLPRIYELPRPLEILNTRDRMLIAYETAGTWREIWTDGRELPKDPDPWWYGHSVGKWVDDYTFVVESNGFNNKTWLDRPGHPHSDQMHLTERFRRLDHDTMDVTFTVDDPKAYTKPWVGTPRIYVLKPTWELEESYCTVEDESRYFNDVTRPSALRAAPEKK